MVELKHIIRLQHYQALLKQAQNKRQERLKLVSECDFIINEYTKKIEVIKAEIKGMLNG